MEFDQSEKLSEFIWINGKIIPWNDAHTHVLTHSLHYSGSVFEGERSYNGKVFKLIEHTSRLLKSAEYMHLTVDYSVEEINQATQEILQKNNLKNAYIRPLIWRGAEALGAYSDILTTNLLIMALESNPKFKNNLTLCLTPWRKLSEKSIPVQAKSSAHYAMISISKKLAQDAGYDDALILDQFDNIAESSTTNIFFATGEELVTPVADCFLNGITRQTIIEMAKNIGIKVKEIKLSLNDIDKYDTCFLTGTSAELSGVASIYDGNKNVMFTNSKMTAILQQEYAKITGKIL